MVGRLVLYGSVLHLLVHVIMRGTPEENLTSVWATVRQLYTHFNVAKGNRYGTLKMSMFKVTGTVKLRGKAGEVRALGPILHRIWQMHYTSDVVVDATVVEIYSKIELCLRLGCRMEAILDEHTDFFALPGLIC